jgi:single-strand DNA-binding protein
MNETTIAGHLGADPEVRFTSSGQKITVLRVAARVRKGAKGEDTIWWRVTIWGEQFDRMIPYFKKGSPIIVFGELSKPEIFTNRDGQPQVSMNVTAHHLLFSPFGRPDGQGGGASQEGEHHGQQHFGGDSHQEQHSQKQFGQGQESPNMQEAFADEEIPF